MVPFVEVSHLPSSLSFYSAVLQALGLRCIYPDPKGVSSPLQSSASFGVDGQEVVLEVRQSENPLRPPRLSTLVISAPSRSAIFAFHGTWLKTDPPSWSLFRDTRGLEQLYNDRGRAIEGPWVNNEGGVTVTRAVIYDHDGNRLEVEWPDPISSLADASKLGRARPRVLEWDHKLEAKPHRVRKIIHSNIQHSSIMAPPHYENSSSESHRSSHGTKTSYASPPPQVNPPQSAQESTSPRQSSRTGGLNTTTVVGALLGAAAGAALTYGLVSNSKESPQSHEQENQRTPLPRRATFPEKPVTGHDYPTRTRYEKRAPSDYSTPRKLVHSSFQPLPIRGTSMDGDEDVEYGVDPFPPPRHLTQGSLIQHPLRSRAPSTTRPVDVDESRRQHKSRVSVGRTASTRARSETPRERVPLVPDEDWDLRGVARTQRKARPESMVSRPPLSRSHRSNHDTDRDSYVSARSHRSAVTARQLERDYRPSEHETIPMGRSSGHVSGTTVRERSREPTGKAPSHVSARRVPLPGSAVGSSHANWDPWDVPLPMSGVGSSHAMWDDDMESLAPSDSISCVGSKGGRRSHRRHH